MRDEMSFDTGEARKYDTAAILRCQCPSRRAPDASTAHMQRPKHIGARAASTAIASQRATGIGLAC